jgi:hypothetical protein
MAIKLEALDSDNIQVNTKVVKSPYFYKVSNIEWVEVVGSSNPSWKNLSATHNWTTLGIYTPADVTKYTIPSIEGGYLDTMINGVGDAYNGNGCLFGKCDIDTFRTSFAPNVRITIPLSGGTGGLSGLTSTTLYSSFIEQPTSTDSTGSGVCSTWRVDSLKSESYEHGTANAGLGYKYDSLNNPGVATGHEFYSGLVYLFTDDINFSGATTGTTWDQGWSGNSRYTYGDSNGQGRTAKFDGLQRDEAVGFLTVDSGQIVIFNQNIVNSFNTSVATGGTITTGATFSSADCNMITQDYDSFTEVNVTFNLQPGEYTETSNTSSLVAKQEGSNCDEVGITEVCCYNDSGILTAIGSLNFPAVKNKDGFTIINAVLSLDGGQRVSEGDTNTL